MHEIAKVLSLVGVSWLQATRVIGDRRLQLMAVLPERFVLLIRMQNCPRN